MKRKIILILIFTISISLLVTGCKMKLGNATIKCNELTGECEILDDGDGTSTDGTGTSGGAGTFVPDEGTLSVSACGPYKAPDKGIFKGFYYNDSEPYSTENRWSMKMCGQNSYFTTAKTTCSDGREYKWTVNKLAKTAFEKVQQGLCQITTTGIDGIVYEPSEITSNGTVVSRFISNTKTPTLHAYGIAVDLNASKDYYVNGVRFKGVYNRDINSYKKFVEALGSESDSRNINYILYVKIFQPLGFNWGGNWKGTSYDGMHYEIDWKQTKK